MRMEEGEQDMLTEVIVGEDPPPLAPPPPQPANKDERIATKANRTRRLKVLLVSQLRTKVTKATSLQ